MRNPGFGHRNVWTLWFERVLIPDGENVFYAEFLPHILARVEGATFGHAFFREAPLGVQKTHVSASAIHGFFQREKD